MMNRNMLIYATIHLLNLLYINKIYRNSEGLVYFLKFCWRIQNYFVTLHPECLKN